MDYISPIHQEILNTLNQISVQVIINDHPICYSRQYDGYVLSIKDLRNTSGKTQLLLCTNVTREFRDDWKREVERTIAHETIHVAQACKSNDGYIRPLGFKDDIEKESFAVQNQPREVLRILKKYCL